MLPSSNHSFHDLGSLTRSLTDTGFREFLADAIVSRVIDIDVIERMLVGIAEPIFWKSFLMSCLDTCYSVYVVDNGGPTPEEGDQSGMLWTILPGDYRLLAKQECLPLLQWPIRCFVEMECTFFGWKIQVSHSATLLLMGTKYTWWTISNFGLCCFNPLPWKGMATIEPDRFSISHQKRSVFRINSRSWSEVIQPRWVPAACK